VNVGFIRENGHIGSLWSCQMGNIHFFWGGWFERWSEDKGCGWWGNFFFWRDAWTVGEIFDRFRRLYDLARVILKQ